MADLCFSDKMSKDDSKARATPQPFTPCGPLAQRGRQAVAPSSALKILCKKDRTAEKCCAPSFCAGVLAARPVCGSDHHRTRRRSLCSRCTPWVSQPRMPACSHAYEHVMLMLTCARACACADVRWGQRLASVATNQGLQDASMAYGHGSSMSWSREARAAAVR